MSPDNVGASVAWCVFCVPRVIATSVYCVSRERRRTRHAIDATDAGRYRRYGSTPRFALGVDPEPVEGSTELAEV